MWVENGVTRSARPLKVGVESFRHVDWSQRHARATRGCLPKFICEREELLGLVTGVLEPKPRSGGCYGHTASKSPRARVAVGRR
jgi:hypothetical protein